MRDRLMVALIVPMLILIGLWGQYQLSPDNLTLHFSRSLYQIISLFFLEGEWTLALTEVPYSIEFVRFTAPMVAIGSFILVFAATTRTSLMNYSVRFKSGHTIVVGLGENCWQFLRTCENKRDFVVVERSPENRLIERVRASGVRVLVGDVFEEGMFDRLNLLRATTLIAFTGNDGTNVELAIKARNRVREERDARAHLKVHIHLNQIGLANQLEGYPKFFADFSIIEISFFSVYDLSARLLLRDYPPEVFADVAGHDHVHLCLYGFSELAEKLILEAAHICHYANSSRLQITVFDPDVQRNELKLRSEYPYLSRICDFRFIDLPAFGPHVFAGDIGKELPTITQHILCLETDEKNLNAALLLRRALLEHRASNAPILVRMQKSSGLAQLLESNTGGPEIPDGLYPFGMLDKVLQADNILTSQLDELAHAIHDMYLQSQEKGDPRTHQALQTWDALPQWERKQNLLKADHWPIRLRATRLRDSMRVTENPTLSKEEAEVQAMMEHNRYVSKKIFDGWSYGQERLEDAKVNPFLVPWRELPVEQRDMEIAEALAQPDFFSSHLKRSMRYTYVIGVSGHRLNKLDIESPSLQSKIVSALQGFRQKYPNHHFIVLSPLAEGADRLVAKLAMEVLGASLQVPLPLPFELYESDFTSAESTEEFKQLVGKAEMYFEMPMRFGNIRELASREDGAGNEARNRQYALAGAYVVQRCDCLLAIYNGEGNAGTGGTSHIVHWYEEGIDDDDYRYGSNYFLASRRDPIIVIDPGALDVH